jgi:outer membrane protein
MAALSVAAARAQPAPAAIADYFVPKTAGTVMVRIRAIGVIPENLSSSVSAIGGHVDVGSVYVLPPTVTLQYHFMPQSRFSPYVGAGMTVAFFYDSHPSLPTVKSVGFSNSVGPAIQAGFDYSVGVACFVNFDVKQIFLNTTARINGGAIVAKTSLDPTIVGAGIGYRF